MSAEADLMFTECLQHFDKKDQELKKKHAARMAKAARRREAINARTAHLRSEVRAAQERGEAVAARPAKRTSLRRQLKG